MKTLLLLLALLLTSCSTTIHDPVTGKKLASIGGDAERVRFAKSADGAVEFSAESLSRSGPIKAVGGVVKPYIQAWGLMKAAQGAEHLVEAFRAPVP